LQKKSIWKSKALSAENQTPLATATASVEQASVGESGSERRIRSIDLAIRSRSDRSPAPIFLQDAVEQLTQLELEGIHVELLTESEEDGWTVPITMLSNEDGEVDINLCIEEANNYFRLRRTAVFLLTREDKHVHVSAVFIESSPVYVKLYRTTSGSSEEIWQALKFAAFDFIYRRGSDERHLSELANWSAGTVLSDLGLHMQNPPPP